MLSEEEQSTLKV